jgi:hypothetical protein
VRRNALRVRNTGCEGVPTGAGFALDPMVLLADRDVLPGAGPLKVAASAGVPRAVEAARVYRLGDFGIARVGSTLPGRMPAGDVDLGESVAVVGYPLTPTPRLLPGIVVDRISGSPFGVRGEVVRLSSVLAHGDPGGPVLDAGGRLVGVAFTTDPRTGFAVAVPLATLRSLVARQALEALPACAGA